MRILLIFFVSYLVTLCDSFSTPSTLLCQRWNRRPSVSLEMSSTSGRDRLSFLTDDILPVAVSVVLWLSPPITPFITSSQDFIIHPQSVNAIETTVIPAPNKAILTLDTPRDRPIMDLSNVLSNQDKINILESIVKAEEKTGSEIQVVICDQIPLGITPKIMATTLFNKWHIGPSSENNGVLILSVIDQRRAEIEIGAGIPTSVIDSEWCTKALEETAVPNFKEQEYGIGISTTIDKISKRLEGNRKVGNALILSEDAKTIGYGVGLFTAFQWLDSVFSSSNNRYHHPRDTTKFNSTRNDDGSNGDWYYSRRTGIKTRLRDDQSTVYSRRDATKFYSAPNDSDDDDDWYYTRRVVESKYPPSTKTRRNVNDFSTKSDRPRKAISKHPSTTKARRNDNYRSKIESSVRYDTSEAAGWFSDNSDNSNYDSSDGGFSDGDGGGADW